jgi:hypothetical protein
MIDMLKSNMLYHSSSKELRDKIKTLKEGLYDESNMKDADFIKLARLESNQEHKKEINRIQRILDMRNNYFYNTL